MIKQINNIMFRYEKEDEKFVNNFNFGDFNKRYEKIKNFFSYPHNLPMIRICLLYSPEEYIFFTGSQTFKKWNSARVGYNTSIYVFAPSSIEKYTTHKKEEVFNLIIHELTHLFYGYSKLSNLPLINEGIAKYFQEGLKKEDNCNYNLTSLKGKPNSKEIYSIGHCFISKIIRRFGEVESGKKLVEFLRKITSQDSEKILFLRFKEIFKIEANEIIQLKGGLKNEKVNTRQIGKSKVHR